MSTVHVPILVEPILAALLEPFRALTADAPARWIVDCTLGGGGHTGAFLAALAAEPALRRHRVLSLDRDAGAVARGRERFAAEIAEGRLVIEHSPFSEARRFLEGRPVLGLMADLGFSSDQLEDAERGLSFQHEGPLDMRLDASRGENARELLERLPEGELEEILREFGEERFAGRIAAAIVERRRAGGVPATTRELSSLVVGAIPAGARHGRIHAATRTFQALRIAVNSELAELDALLGDVLSALEPGARVAILSFHSLEDRRVKLALKERGTREERAAAAWHALTKKPVEADNAELARNPRARSAKLRLAEKKLRSDRS